MEKVKKEHAVVTILKNCGLTLTGIGAKYGYSRASMSKALRVPHQAIETIISREIGMPVSELFPERYEDGFPNYLKRG
jgi:lambda repressor-like predicted transcriptional regulator